MRGGRGTMRRSKPWVTNRARVLRSKDVAAEQSLWQALRNRSLGGFKFVRQEPIGDYFADFVYRELKLVVEVDGATHGAAEEQIEDRARETYLARSGYQVMRVSNENVRTNLSGVLDTIMAELNCKAELKIEQAAAPHPNPLPAGGERA